MSMFGPNLGWWTVRSESDPRWNNQGEGEGLVSAGGPREMQDWIEECTKKYGNPPADATMSFHKY